MHNRVRLAAIGALALTVVGCNLSEPAPFDPRSLQHAERVAADSERPGRMGPLPTTMEGIPDNSGSSTDAYTPGQAGPILDGRPTIRLSLQQIIHRAVVHSREVRVAGYDPAVARTRILEAEAHFDPVFFSKATYTDQVILSPTSGVLPGANPFQPDIFRTVDVQAGLRENLPAGGTVEMRYDVQRIQRVPVTAGELNPYTVNDLAVQITQPLLRDLGYDVNQARVTIARNDYKVSLLDYRKALEENLAELERDYWQLAEAEREEIVQEDLLARSRATYSVLRQRAELDATSVQVTQADAKLKAREADLINIKQKIRTTSQNVKRRMNDPEFPVAGDVIILSEIPELETPVHFVLRDLIATALANRFELGQQTLREDSATIAAKVAKYNLLPKLDLIGTMDVQGPGQDFAHALQNQGRSDFWGGSIGLSFEYPLGNREARSIYRRAMLQRLQAIEQYGFLVEQITEDVTTALIAVESDWQSIQGRRSQKFSAEANLNAYEEQRRVGNIQKLDYYYVSQLLDAQEALGDAERQEALAIAQYYVDIAVLERAKGTLLRYNNIVMSEEQFKRNEQWWRIYVKHQPNWIGGGEAKLSRATSLTSDHWTQAMIAHVWSGQGDSLTLDPASGVIGDRIVTTRYNDFANLHWLGNKPSSEFQFSSPKEGGWWVCVESYAKLNTPGEKDGINKVWIDGKLAAVREHLNWRGNYTSHGINAVYLEAYWNQGSPVDQKRWIDNFVVSAKPIGPMTCPRNPVLIRSQNSDTPLPWQAELAMAGEDPKPVWRSKSITGSMRVTVDGDNGEFLTDAASSKQLAGSTTYLCRLREVTTSGAWAEWTNWHQSFLTEK